MKKMEEKNTHHFVALVTVEQFDRKSLYGPATKNIFNIVSTIPNSTNVFKIEF